MKRQFTAFAGSLVMAAAVVAAQGTPKPIPPTSFDQPQQTAPEAKPKQTADVVLTGCLIQGSGPTVFLLDNAKLSAADPAEHAQTFVLRSEAEDVNFKNHLNHEVTITGSTMPVKGDQPPAGKKIEEKDLPTLAAKSLTMVSDRCPSTF
jgi:hypothetical protein